ncbi:MAG: pantoate kinase [Natronomonas sp.]
MSSSATAFVPGHITGFFGVKRTDEPLRTGSLGAGMTLSDGVTVRVVPEDSDDASTLELDGEVVSVDAVDRVCAALDVRARIVAESVLPLGAGFGVSGALSLGTALAAASALDLSLSENELLRIAHGAEVRAGTGLGDAVAQARGGLPIRLDPGAPPHGKLDGIPTTERRIEYLTFGELSTETVLSGDTETLTAAGRRALSTIVADPTLPTLMYASRRFAREADLLTPRVRKAIQAVGDEGGEASMAMLGNTVFALDEGLTDAGYDAASCTIDLGGATLR